MVFSWLATLASPFIKPIAETAWEGIKNLGRSLFGVGQSEIRNIASTAIKTVG